MAWSFCATRSDQAGSPHLQGSGTVRGCSAGRPPLLRPLCVGCQCAGARKKQARWLPSRLVPHRHCPRAEEKAIGLGQVLGRGTMHVFVRGDCTMIAAPVQCDVDGIPKGSHLVTPCPGGHLRPPSTPTTNASPRIRQPADRNSHWTSAGSGRRHTPDRTCRAPSPKAGHATVRDTRRHPIEGQAQSHRRGVGWRSAGPHRPARGGDRRAVPRRRPGCDRPDRPAHRGSVRRARRRTASGRPRPPMAGRGSPPSAGAAGIRRSR